jgi:hypothetical protein
VGLAAVRASRFAVRVIGRQDENAREPDARGGIIEVAGVRTLLGRQLIDGLEDLTGQLGLESG